MTSYISLEKLDPLNVSPIVVSVPPLPSKVLKAVVGGSVRHSHVDHYINETFDDIWFKTRMYIPQTTINDLIGSDSGRFISNMSSLGSVSEAVHIFNKDEEVGFIWYGWHAPFTDPPPSGYPLTPIGDVWHIVEMHRVADGINEILVNDVLAWTGVDDLGSLDTEYLRLGPWNAVLGAPTAEYYFDYLYVGTSRGASDIFSENFESGTFGEFEYDNGDVSVIDNPFS